MTTATTTPDAPAVAASTTAPEARLSWKTPIALGVFAVLAFVLLVVFTRPGISLM